METKYLMMLLVIPTITLSTPLMGMQVVPTEPPVQISKEVVPTQKESETSIDRNTKNADDDWEVIGSEEIDTQSTKIISKSIKARLCDMAIGATAIVVVEGCLIFYYGYNTIKFAYKHGKDIVALYEMLKKLMAEDA